MSDGLMDFECIKYLEVMYNNSNQVGIINTNSYFMVFVSTDIIKHNLHKKHMDL